MDSLKKRSTYMRRQSGLLAIRSTNVYIILKGNFWDVACDESKCSRVSTPQRHAVTSCRGAISQTLHKYFGIISLFVIANTYRQGNGFGGLGVACWPLVPKFADSNPAEAVRFLGRKKILSTPSFGGESKAVGPMS